MYQKGITTEFGGIVLSKEFSQTPWFLVISVIAIIHLYTSGGSTSGSGNVDIEICHALTIVKSSNTWENSSRAGTLPRLGVILRFINDRGTAEGY